MNTTQPSCTYRLQYVDLARLAAILGFVGIAYFPSLGVPFVFDDFHNIVLNRGVHPDGLGDLTRLFDADSVNTGGRFVAMLTFALNYLVSGHDPFSYHVVNIVIHGLAACTLYLLLVLLAQAPHSPESLRRNARVFAFAVALIWAVHPVNTQAVTYIVQRMASLAGLFYLLALLAFACWRTERLSALAAWIAIVSCFLLGMLTKQHVVTLPLALILLDAAFFDRPRRRHAVLAAAICSAGIVPALLLAGDSLAYLFEAPAHRDFSGIERLLTQGRVIVHYLTLLAWPDADRLQLDYDFVISRGLLDPPTTLAAWALLLGCLAWSISKFRRQTWPAAGWIFFLLTLSVESTIILLEIAFEHRLYLPSTLLMAGVLAPIFMSVSSERARTATGTLSILLAAVLVWQTMERNEQWLDQGMFWSQDRARGASPYRSGINGALELARQGRPREALEQLAQVPADLPPSLQARIEQARGEILSMLGRPEEALNAHLKALELSPGSPRAAYATAQAMIQVGQLEAAEDMLRQLQEQLPRNVFTHILEAEIAIAHDRPLRARDILHDYLQENPGVHISATNLVRLHLAHVHRVLGETRAAAQQYRLVVQADPIHWGGWANLYHMLRAGGDHEQARAVARYLERHGVDPGAWAPGQTITVDGPPGAQAGESNR